MATQTLQLNVPSTCPLVFTAADGTTGPGPIGAISASDPSVTVGLSADGQSANATMTVTLINPATLTWHDTRDPTSLPSGESLVPDFTVDVTDAPAVFVPVSGSFGTFAPGTTN